MPPGNQLYNPTPGKVFNVGSVLNSCYRFLGECYLESGGHGCEEEGLLLLRQAVALYTSQFNGLDLTTLSTYDILVTALIKQVITATIITIN